MSCRPKTLLLKNIILTSIVLLLITYPLVSQRGAAFQGTDGQAERVISEVRPDYAPWIHSVWEPPSGEIESLLFSLQAALGSGLLFYYLGYMKGRKKERENKMNHVQH